MKTYDFIHPVTGDVFSVEGKLCFEDNGFWIVKINSKVVAMFKTDYSFIVHSK